MQIGLLIIWVIEPKIPQDIDFPVMLLTSVMLKWFPNLEQNIAIFFSFLMAPAPVSNCLMRIQEYMNFISDFIN